MEMEHRLCKEIKGIFREMKEKGTGEEETPRMWVLDVSFM